MQYELLPEKVVNNPNFTAVKSIPSRLPDPLPQETFTMPTVNLPTPTSTTKYKQGNYGELYQFSVDVYALLDHPYIIKTIHSFVHIIMCRAQISAANCWAHFDPKKVLELLNQIQDESGSWFDDVVDALRTSKMSSVKNVISRSQKQIQNAVFFELLSAYEHHKLSMVDEVVKRSIEKRKSELVKNAKFHAACASIFEIILNDNLLSVVRETFDMVTKEPHLCTKNGKKIQEPLDVWELIEDDACRARLSGFVAEVYVKLHSKLRGIRNSKLIDEKCRLFGICVDLLQPARSRGSSRLEFQEKAYKRLTNE